MKKYLSDNFFLNVTNLGVITFVLMMGFSFTAKAQGDGARFYWKGLSGTNAIPIICSSLGGNANPMDPSHNVNPGADFEGKMCVAGYAKILPLFNRSAIVSLLVPMGNISSDVSINGLNSHTTARGYGDPMLQFDVNIIGPKAIRNIPDMLRYEPGFSVDIMGSLAFPIGEYDSSSSINIGQNRWYGRVGVPIIWQIGSWAPNKRTTVEFLPAVWLFSDNNDFVGQKMSTDPMYQLEGHITRNFMEKVWGSLDGISYIGGKATVGTLEGQSMSNLGIGATLGYQINDNMQLTLSYNSTVNDNSPDDLKMDGFRITFVHAWHPLIEGMKRLGH